MSPEMGAATSLDVGGAPLVTLELPAPPDPDRPALVSAQVLPGRGMMTLRLRALLPQRGEVDLLAAPPLDEAREQLAADGAGFPGNASFSMGGAVLLPFANRIRGELSPDGKTLSTQVAGRRISLPANWSGKEPGAERHALHGLLLAARVEDVRRRTTGEEDRLDASFQAGDFGVGWPSETEVSFEYVLRSESLSLTITARNVGAELLPVGIGWHPYFLLPSGRREQARLHLPAGRRVPVNDYDDVFPTGEVVPVAGTPYDFSIPGGRPLGNLYLDDCLVDLQRSTDGHTVAEIVDPAASYGLRIVALSPRIRAFQVYAPADPPHLAVEPQFNLADPFGAQWGPDADTGMALLEPGEAAVYAVRLEPFTPLPASTAGRTPALRG